MPQRLNEITLGDVMRGVSRYRPFIATVAAIVLVAVVLPGDPPRNETSGSAGLQEGDIAADSGELITEGGDTGAESSAGGGGSAGGTVGGGTVGSFNNPVDTVAELTKRGVDLGRFCDTATGRVAMPYAYSTPCKAVLSGNNGGKTYQGVTDKEIIVAVYRGQTDPATEAALIAAGVNDERDEVDDTRKTYLDMFHHFYNTYGRKVKLVDIEASGESDDDAAGKADAIKVATEVKAFASLGAPNNTYVSELAARKVLCICTTSQPQESYDAWKGYAGYTTLMASTQGYVHRAEYIGKRLAGRNAKWSENATYQVSKRTFGLIYYETADKAYKSGVEFFVRELKSKYNVTLTDKIAYVFDLPAAQEQARTIIGRLKDKDVTSVVFSGDPIYPAVFTAEATNQQYFPEWVITGSALTDTNLFARTYDKNQWSNAFGISFLTAKITPTLQSSWFLHEWYAGSPPQADDTHGVILPPVWTLMAGIHQAGPNLTPMTWKDGLFALPPTPQVGGKLGGGITNALSSFGRHGIWRWTDYLALDDTTEIWWDNTATGPDELGNDGVGMYQFVDGGKRYLPGTWPKTTPQVIGDDNGKSVTIYSQAPAADKVKSYPCTGCPSQG